MIIVPNYVYSELSIRGDSDTLKEIEQRIAYDDPDIKYIPIWMNHILPMPSDILGSKDESSWCDKHWEVSELFDIERMPMRGHEGSCFLDYEFKSIRNAPRLVFAALSKMFPTVTVELTSEYDINGAYQRVTFQNGECIKYEEMDWHENDALKEIQNKEIEEIIGGN